MCARSGCLCPGYIYSNTPILHYINENKAFRGITPEQLKELLMDFHLEREIRLIKESEHDSLYKWSLQEFDGDGNKIGENQIPWYWSLNFTASELRYSRSLHFTQPEDEKDEVEENELIKEGEKITAILHSGTCYDGKWLQDDTAFSMFGTDRKASDFKLYIYKLDDGDATESCEVYGCASYTFEIDFIDETVDDLVEIYMALSPQRFNNLVETIKTQPADAVEVRLKGVSGFYSEWTPTVSTDSIKILTADENQKVVNSDDCDITPPRLGEVGEFDLTVIQRCKLNLKQDYRSINIHKLFEEEEAEEVEEEEENFANAEQDTNAVYLAQLVRNELAIKKLRTPLWLIFILLLLLFLK